jgi:ribosomal protein L34E
MHTLCPNLKCGNVILSSKDHPRPSKCEKCGASLKGVQGQKDRPIDGPGTRWPRRRV